MAALSPISEKISMPTIVLQKNLCENRQSETNQMERFSETLQSDEALEIGVLCDLSHGLFIAQSRLLLDHQAPKGHPDRARMSRASEIASHLRCIDLLHHYPGS